MAVIVTESKLKTNPERYLDMLSENKTVLITHNGKLVGKLSNPCVSNVEAITGILEGMLPPSFDRHDLREMRLHEG